MMKITGLSHLFKWENLHNWWLTKYFFAPLYTHYIYKYKIISDTFFIYFKIYFKYTNIYFFPMYVSLINPYTFLIYSF